MELLEKPILMASAQESIVVARTSHHEKNSRLKALFGHSKVRISLLSDGTLISDRKDPLSATNDGINLNGAKFQYFFQKNGSSLHIVCLHSSQYYLL